MTNNVQNGRYDESAIDRLFNGTVYGSGSEKIGGVGQVYLNDASGQPEWVTVKTGLFGANETFVPLKNAQIQGDDIHVPYTKDFIKDAPNVDPDKHIDENEQQALYDYYARANAQGERFNDNTRTETAGVGTAGYANTDVREGERRDDLRDDRQVAEAKDGEMVAHEERLNVGTQREEAGRVKLRKRVVTEHQTMTVPVQHEELVVDRQPLDGKDAIATDHKIGEDMGRDEEIVLHEERPVVSKETVATEKVNVGKRTVTENETVSADVQKEQIEVQGENVQDAGYDNRTAGDKLKDKFDGNPNT